MIDRKTLLENARNRIADISRWGTHALAGKRTLASSTSGSLIVETVPPNSPDACNYCAFGALAAEANMSEYPMYESFHSPLYLSEYDLAGRALDEAARQLFGMDVISVNDRKGHEAALAVFDHAIAAVSGPPTNVFDKHIKKVA